MLLYLTSNENVGLFDFITNEFGIIVKKLSGEFYLNKFVIHDAKNFSHFSYIAIDLESLQDEEDEIIESINAFQTMYDARIIFLAEKIEQTLLDRIIKETKIYNIITGQTIEKIQEEIRICISTQGMSKEQLLKSINLSMDESFFTFPQYSFMAENIKIILAGSMSRIGTTTAAINLCSYLASIGAKVSYTEANKNNHLKQIHDYFFSNIPIKNYSFFQGGVNYFFNGNLPTDNYNFNIIDIGVLTETNKKIFDIAEIRILCGGTKPYEVPELLKTVELLDTDNCVIFLPQEGKTNMKKNIPYTLDQLHFIKSSLDLFDKNINLNIWQKILDPYVVEIKTL